MEFRNVNTSNLTFKYPVTWEKEKADTYNNPDCVATLSKGEENLLNVVMFPTRTNIEETGGANIIFVTKDNTVVTPKSNTILPSITRRSLMVVAKEYLGMEVEEREVYFDEIKDFAECGLCGTAAVISPVGKIVDHGKEICFPSGMDEMGPVTKKLYDTLTGIQMGRIEAPEGWIKVIE